MKNNDKKKTQLTGTNIGSASDKDPIKLALTEAKVKMLFSNPFYANIVISLGTIDASKWLDNITCDGRNIYYNREFIKSRTKEQLSVDLIHVILHCIYDHLGRRGSRDPMIWDYAIDEIVNHIINKSQNIKPDFFKVNPEYHLSDKFNEDMSAEEIYELLKKNSTQIKMNMNGIDTHLDMDGKSGNERDKNGSNPVQVTIQGSGDGPPSLTKDDLQQLKDEFISKVISIAQSSKAGDIPAAIERMLDRFKEPSISWREVLARTMISAIKNDYSFMIPARRSWTNPGKMFFPGQTPDLQVNVACIIDMSGSIGEDQAMDLISEVRGITEQYPCFNIIMFTFDTKVYNLQKYDNYNGDELTNYQLIGGGGTDFSCIFDALQNPRKAFSNDKHSMNDIPDEIEIDTAIILTDLYCDNYGDAELYSDKLLWIVHNNSNDDLSAPYGMTVKYTPKEE